MLADGPDYLAAKTRLETIELEFAGLTPSTAARAELKRFKTDRKIRAELRAWTDLARLEKRYSAHKPGQHARRVRDLEALIKRRAGTQAADQAKKTLAELRK